MTTVHDPGGKVRLRLLPGVCGMADFSPCGRYRYWLSRFWDEATPRGRFALDVPYALWIGMNPSTAAEDIDDPTIRKEMHFTRQMGLSGYIKVNCMDYRSTHPKDLLAPGVRPCSGENFAMIAKLARHAKVIISAWGKVDKPLCTFVSAVSYMLLDYDLLCMGTNKNGSPKHPLYLANTTKPQIWRRARFCQVHASAPVWAP